MAPVTGWYSAAHIPVGLASDTITNGTVVVAPMYWSIGIDTESGSRFATANTARQARGAKTPRIISWTMVVAWRTWSCFPLPRKSSTYVKVLISAEVRSAVHCITQFAPDHGCDPDPEAAGKHEHERVFIQHEAH